ncbi:MAG: hypothetical protein JWR25_812, partial [Noviherbaspirillum sp.]|nr:hypothetical protein [Noviherbaspirillum sp.]
VGGSLHTLLNGVSVCSICHGVFDSGLLWVELDAAGVQRIFVHEDSRAVQHFQPLHSKLVRMPSDPTFAFPGAVAWQWRKEWAPLKRQWLRDKADAELAKSMADASLQEPQTPKVPCSCGVAGNFKNQKCPNKLCKSCCGLVGGCVQARHPSSAAAANGAPAAASAAASAAAAASTCGESENSGSDRK